MSRGPHDSSRLRDAANQLLREATAAGVPFEKGAPFPLDYGHEEARTAAANRDVRVVVDRAGGWRQVVFALGMALALGGLGAAVSRSLLSEGTIAMTLGGALIGVALPLRWRGNAS
jgi:hypothetical protein